MEYGYCRISTATQSIERQVRNILSAYPKAKIYKEVYTGTKTMGRKKLEYILKQAKAGDTIIFDSVSRMSRNANDGVQLYMKLYEQGINLVFIKEPHINTDTFRLAVSQSIDKVGNEIADIYIEATNKVLMLLAKKQIELAFEQSEKEVSDLYQRTKEGIETARQNGKQIGQVKGAKLNVKKAAAAKKIIRTSCKTFGGTLTDEQCAAAAGVSRKTYYKYKAELRSEFESEGLQITLDDVSDKGVVMRYGNYE